nr:hypothetical protein [Oedogonium sp. 244]
MGQKINPRAIRISGSGQLQNNKHLGAFTNIWFSDYQYYSLFYQPFYIKKTLMSILMKYYKNRVRFLKGRHRRLKSLFRFHNFSCLYLPYKMQLLCSIHRHASNGLQRKHTAFIMKQKKIPSKKIKKLYGKKITDMSYLPKKRDLIISSSYLKRLELVAGLVWKKTLKNQ